MKLLSIEKEAAACRRANSKAKEGDLILHLHHEVLAEALSEPIDIRIAYVLSNKPKHQQALRLRLMRVVPKSVLNKFPKAYAERGKADAEWKRAVAERKKADAEWEKADAEWKRADAEWEKADTEREKAVAERGKADAEWKRAVAEREKADTEREKADTEREKADAEWGKAVAEREKAYTERKKAYAEWKKADTEREKAVAEREKAYAEREKAYAERGRPTPRGEGLRRASAINTPACVQGLSVERKDYIPRILKAYLDRQRRRGQVLETV